jgi:site-specific recombinase XerD
MTERKIKVTAEDIEGDPAFQYYQEKHDISEHTMAGYINALQRYVEFTGLTLTELVKEAENEETKNIPKEKRQLGQRLRGFRKHLKALDLAPASIRRMLAGVKSFYTNGYSIELPKLGKDRALAGKLKPENKGIPSKEDIIKVLDIADMREKAIILGITSSGLSTKDFVNLRVKDFREGYDEETGITVLDSRRAKTAQDFVTFFSAEATDVISEYLRWRERDKPKTAHPDILNGWEKHGIYSSDNYLICKKYIPNSYRETKNEGLRKESEAGLQTVFRQLASRAGISREKGMWNMFRAHKLRSWFYSQMLNNSCPQDLAEVFMGHTSKLGSSGGTYYTAIVPKLKEAYLEFMPHLSLLTPVETKVIESKSYKELKSQNEALKERIAAMEAREEARDIRDEKISGIDTDLTPLFKKPNVQAELIKALIEEPEIRDALLRKKRH